MPNDFNVGEYPDTYGGGGGGIPTVLSWDDLAALEPAAVGTQRIITGGVDGATLTGDCLVERGPVGWYLPSSDATARAYMNAHPIPNLSPKSDYTYILPSGGFLDGGADTPGSISYNVEVYPTGPDNTFTSLRIGLANIGAAYTVNRCYIMRSDNASTSITEDISTGLVTIVGAPTVIAAGTDEEPTWTWLGASSTSWTGGLASVKVLIELAVDARRTTWGDYAWSGLGWYVTNQEQLTTNLSSSISFTGSQAWDGLPLMTVKFENLSTPICWLPCVGDSWFAGYGDGPGPYRPVGWEGRLDTSWYTNGDPIGIMLFGRSGYTTTQSLSRLESLLANFDCRAAVVQFNSLNNVSAPLPDTQCRTDWAIVEDLMGSRKLAPLVGGGTLDSLYPGWFTAWKANSDWMVARNADTNVDVYDTLVSPTTGEIAAGLAYVDNSHPDADGYTTWASDMITNLRALLSSWGV